MRSPNGACARWVWTTTSPWTAHFYSVPYRHAPREGGGADHRSRRGDLPARRAHRRHLRGSGDGKHTTLNEHMPASHCRYSDWTIERILTDARACGPSATLLCEVILEHRPHPEQGFRTTREIVRLANIYGARAAGGGGARPAGERAATARSDPSSTTASTDNPSAGARARPMAPSPTPKSAAQPTTTEEI